MFRPPSRPRHLTSRGGRHRTRTHCCDAAGWRRASYVRHSTAVRHEPASPSSAVCSCRTVSRRASRCCRVEAGSGSGLNQAAPSGRPSAAGARYSGQVRDDRADSGLWNRHTQTDRQTTDSGDTNRPSDYRLRRHEQTVRLQTQETRTDRQQTPD